MKRDFARLAEGSFDLTVIGGGIVGAGIARDAALRGLRTLLLEKEDFGCGTTSRSSRLVHGGLRYLRHLDFGLVRQDLREREILVRIAPHLVQPLPFLVPVTGATQRIVLSFGMRLYNWLSYDRSLPGYDWLSREETIEAEPGLRVDGLTGAYRYYDCQVPFAERLCLENIVSADEGGAVPLNHARVTGLARAGEAWRVSVRDELTGDVREATSRIVVNATGPWAGDVLAILRGGGQVLRRTRGVHLVVPKISQQAIVIFARSDGRLLFVIPWQDCSLIGTTDTDYTGNLDSVFAGQEDIEYLLAEASRVFPTLHREDVFYTMAGLRALVSSGKRASNVSRAHRVIDHERTDGLSGLVSVLGGKMTGSRGIAEEVTDLVGRKLGMRVACTTATTPLPGATGDRGQAQAALDAATLAHLEALYGARRGEVLELVCEDARGGQPLCSHASDIVAEVWHAVKTESAMTVSDFLLRRSLLGLAPSQGLDAVDAVATEMGALLGWDAATRQRQADEYRTQAALGRQYLGGSKAAA